MGSIGKISEEMVKNTKHNAEKNAEIQKFGKKEIQK